MANTIELKLKITLEDDVPEDDPKIREIVSAVVDGRVHQGIHMVEMLEFEPKDE